MRECSLEVKDEVNVKIHGLELEHRRALSQKFKYEIPGARYMPAVRLGRWDGTVSFFHLGGSTYISLLEHIVPMLEEWNYDIELNDCREYRRKFEFEEVHKDSYKDIEWPPGHPAQGQPIELRDYQVDVINKFLNNKQSLQEVATGAGKTLITAVLSQKIEAYGRSIVIVPNKSLVRQTEADYVNMGLDVGVYFGDRKEFGKTHTICTWQSLNILLKGTRAKEVDITIGEFLQDVECVIVDEVHMAKADALKALLTGPMSHIPMRWGLTGTIPKEEFEFMSLKCSIGEVINRMSASELQEKGVLANCHVNIVQLQDYKEYRDYQSELKYLTSNEERMKYIARLIGSVRQSGNTLILVDRISAGKLLTKHIEDSKFISGGTKTDERKANYDSASTSDQIVLVCTYGVASVGINIPRIFNLVLVEPGKSFVRVIQSIGRGIRKAEDKDFVQIWDITSTCKFAKRHLTKRKHFYREAKYPFTIEKTEWEN